MKRERTKEEQAHIRFLVDSINSDYAIADRETIEDARRRGWTEVIEAHDKKWVKK